MKDAVILFSGGEGSFLAACLYIKKNPDKSTVLYFNDTKIEDPDLYRFIHEAAAYLNKPLVEDSDGRDVWQVFEDTKFIGNSRIDPCSRVLKRERSHNWISKNAPNAEIVIGIDWTEIHRLEKAQAHWQGKLVAPLCEDLRTKKQIRESLDGSPPSKAALYAYGFAHNNCGGFCVKAGLGQFQLLLDNFPDRFMYHENKEQELLKKGIGRPFLRKTINGELRYITMKEFREVYSQKNDTHGHDFGGCGCAI